MTFTKINAQNVEIFKQVCASAKTDMSVSEIDHLIGNLFEIKEAKAAASSADAQRIERMNATKADPKFDTIRAKINAELKQIGLGGIAEFAKTGTMKKLDDAIHASTMVVANDGMQITIPTLSDERRLTLKDGLYALGLI
jgi:hypothetical protein